MLVDEFKIEGPNVRFGEDEISSSYEYQTSSIERSADGKWTVRPKSTPVEFKTKTQIPKLGVMLVGWGGNNGSTLTAGILANKHGITWMTKEGVRKPNYWGSLTQASTCRVGNFKGEEVYVAFNKLLPMVDPNDIVLGGWDISNLDLAESMERAQVLDFELQRQLVPYMKSMTPLPGIYDPDFIAANQDARADNLITGSKREQMDQVRQQIREFKSSSGVDKVIVLWTANTERYSDVVEGINDTADNFLQAIDANESEVAPSSIYAAASILEGTSSPEPPLFQHITYLIRGTKPVDSEMNLRAEPSKPCFIKVFIVLRSDNGVPFINGAPQNTFVPGLMQLAIQKKVMIGGDDFKSGQTKMKSVLVDFLVGAGIKPTSIVSYNHLGNNDGMNLSAPQTFRSKEISKSNVVDDMVASNSILYAPGEHPDHVVVIKYVPYVADSKRAMDEYSAEIFMGGRQTIVMHNTCEDSLLAAPIILDLVILAELLGRIEFKQDGESGFHHFHPVASLLSYLTKAPIVPDDTPVVNALAKQRAALENIIRACVGLPPENNMMLEFK